MNYINTSPDLLAKVIAFRENDLNLTVNLDPAIVFIPSDIRAEVWSDYKLLFEVSTLEFDDHNITIIIDRDQVRTLPQNCKCFLIINDVYKLGYVISPELGFNV